MLFTDEHISNDGVLPADALPALEPGAGFDLLNGVRIIDLTTSVAGPSATMLLADLGAEVIKIERRGGGDDTRSWGPPFLNGEALWFAAVNRSKKSVALDFTTESGLQLLYELVAQADMVFVNLPPRVAKKLKVDPAALRTARPDLIYVSITGFGISGDRADWACYDLIAEGYSGIMDITGASDRGPQKIGAPAADMLAGQDAAFAGVAALFARQATGQGKVVDVALVDSMTRMLSCRLMSYLGSGELPTRTGGTDSVIAIYQVFETADEPITLALGNDAIWHRFWAVVENIPFGARSEFGSNADRRQRRAEIVEQIARLLKAKPQREWLALFRAARVPAGPINKLDAVASDENLLSRGMFYRLALPGGGYVPQVGPGILIDGEAGVARSAPPSLGEHTDEVFGSLLAMTADQLLDLRQRNIIGRIEA